jgi:hypothetical protein
MIEPIFIRISHSLSIHPTPHFGKIGILRDTSEKNYNPTLMLLKEKPALTISQLAEKLN